MSMNEVVINRKVFHFTSRVNNISEVVEANPLALGEISLEGSLVICELVKNRANFDTVSIDESR
jgi:hypothetical protein